MKPSNAKKIDFADLFSKSNKQDERFFSKSLVNVHEFYLCGDIESADEYIQWFDTIRHSSETDVIKIYINSYGGDVFTAIQFMRALKETSATVVMSVEGACMSAATMIFLCGDSFEVSEHSAFMIHTYSGGMIGKGHEMHSQAQYERAWSINLIKEVYEGFLTDAEIQKVIDGADMWMDGDEVVKRLEEMKAKMDKEAESEEDTEPAKPAPKQRKPKETAEK